VTGASGPRLAPPAGAARLPGCPGDSSAPPGPARRLPTRRRERFAGPEDLLWGPHLGARDPSGSRSLLDPVYDGRLGGGLQAAGAPLALRPEPVTSSVRETIRVIG
jgi:hypothetical protein